MAELDDLTRDYRAAFLRYLPRRSEAAMTLGYQLGRDAVVRGISVLDLSQVHHAVLAEVLADTPTEETAAVTAAASDFLLEVLATYDMAHRGLAEVRKEDDRG